MDWFIGALKKYAVFEGRARRKEFWMFYLFFMLFFVALVFVEVGLTGDATVLSGIYFLGTLVPGLAVTVRRLHEIDKSGLWYFISFVPLVWPITILIFLLTEGTTGDNKYGPDPKFVLDVADE